jgi:hypothetical protein
METEFLFPDEVLGSHPLRRGGGPFSGNVYREEGRERRTGESLTSLATRR